MRYGRWHSNHIKKASLVRDVTGMDQFLPCA
jgi:hypothetical protein